MTTESIVYLLRKTSLTRAEIGKLSPGQFAEIVKEVQFQEAVESYRQQYATASILAAIYNTIPRKRGSKTYKPDDFLRTRPPQRNEESIEKLAEDKGIKLPTKEKREEL